MSSPAVTPVSTAAVDAATTTNNNVSNISDAKLAANRANAQHSSGPVTPEGKAISSRNAVKTGLTGRTVLLPSEDAATYQAHIERHLNKYTPWDDEERTLVQLIADTEWRLLRVAPLEAAFYAVGERKLPADIFADETDPVRRAHLLQAEIAITFRKDFSNLALQEGRLNRQLDKYKADLKAIQAPRRKRQAEQLEQAPDLIIKAEEAGKRFDPRDVGFDFTSDQLEYFAGRADRKFAMVASNRTSTKSCGTSKSSRKPPKRRIKYEAQGMSAP